MLATASSYQAKLIARKRLFDSLGLRDGDLFYDLGAFEGDELRVLAADGVEVHSFEPHPWLYRELVRRYGHYGKCRLVNSCAWSSNGELELYLPRQGENYSRASVFDHGDGGRRAVKVPTVDFAEYVASVGRPAKATKLNVEGAEYEILGRVLDAGLIGQLGTILLEDHEELIDDQEWKLKKEAVLGKMNGTEVLPWV